MSGRGNADVSAARWRTVWRMHEQGDGGRAIARFLGIDEKAVRYYIAKGRPAELLRNNAAEQQPVSSAPDVRVSSAPNVIPIRRTS